ncbi:MAG: aminotransferase class III-fold pyridoxal phosphate-dependent enzyme [Chitinophagales bacterium]
MKITKKQAIYLAKKHYGISATAKKLVAYEDFNFRLSAKNGRTYVLKISTDTSSFPYLKPQNKILQHLAKSKKNKTIYPQIIPSKNNKYIVSLRKEGKKLKMRLLSYLEGECIGNISPNNELLKNFGSFLAKLDKKLYSLNISQLEARHYAWDLTNFADSEPYMSYIENPYQQTLVRYFLSQFKNFVAPILPKLPHSIIHSDANEWNTLFKKNKIVGIIDFGDVIYSARINEIAIGIAYMTTLVENPLQAACIILKAYNKIIALEEKELEVLYYLIATRLCISVSHSSYHKTQNPENEYITISATPIWNLLEKWIKVSPIRATNMFKKTCGFEPIENENYDAFVSERHQFISKALSISYETPLKMEKSALQYMYDAKGDTYLDGVNNIPTVGHCHPKVVATAQKQMALLNTNTRYLYDSLNIYAKNLCATFPDKLNKVFFVNSGSAASDLALRLARNYTKRKNVVVVEHAYHGNMTTGIDLSPYKFEGKGGAGQANYIFKTKIPDVFRHQNSEKSCLEVCIADLKEKASEKNDIAAFFCESILGCGGQVVLPNHYLKEAFAHIRKIGGVCVADEVQTGFGRVGSHFWAFELQDVVPDIVILGKPMANGHPMGAVVTTNEIAMAFENGMEFFSSFGGNPVSCVIAQSVLEVIKNENMQENALIVGNFLLEKLNELKKRYCIIGEVRGHGLFLGIELIKSHKTLEPAEKEATHIVNELRIKHKILLSTDGPFHNVLKFKPPLCFTLKNAKYLLHSLESVLQKLVKH